MPTTLTLPPTARALAAHLHERLRERWQGLPDADTGTSTLAFHAAPVPDDLPGHRAELIVEASDLHALHRAMTSDADAVVIDFDDTFSPLHENVQAAYDALAWATATEKPLLVRTRALYATEPHLDFGGPGIAALCDLSAVLAARPERPPHFYIPKLEAVAEAQFWQDALSLAEAYLNLPADTIRVCLQIETYAGLLNADALLQAMHSRAYGLNAGRWDYVFSLVKHLGQTRTAPVPPRSQLTMDVPAMQAYAGHLVAVCRQHGAEAIGGTASLAPDPEHPQPALDAVRIDKEREAAQGFTAAWAGLPELVGAVRAGIAAQSKATPQSAALTAPLKREPQQHKNADWEALQSLPSKGRWPVGPDSQSCEAEGLSGHDLQTIFTDLPTPTTIPLAELRDSISLALDVFTAWLTGRGVVVRNGRVEDTATAELARALVWQWVRVGAALDDGTVLTPERYMNERRAVMPDNAGAARLLDHLVLSPDCPAYFPREAQHFFPDLFPGPTSLQE